MNTNLKEVETILEQHVINDPEYKAFREKCTKMKVLGLRIPVIRSLVKQGFSFENNSPTQILKTWDSIWKTTNTHEARTLALYYYNMHLDVLDDTHWHTLKSWIKQVDSWEHADSLCALYSIFLERFPTLVTPQLKTWNASKNPWERRASVVSTIYYASKNRTAPNQSLVFELLTPLLQDTDAYVQKGVGWQLREAYNLWPTTALAFIKKHNLILPAITFSYATEKLTPTQKAPLKTARANHRKQLTHSRQS